MFFFIEIARSLVLKKKAGEIEAKKKEKSEDANAMYYLHPEYCPNHGISHVNEVASDNSSSPKFREKLANTIYWILMTGIYDQSNRLICSC